MYDALKTLTIAALLLAPAACGGGGTSTNGAGGGTSSSTGSHTTSTGTGGTGPTAEKACGDEALAVCALRDTCSPGFDTKRVYGTDALCQSRTKQTCINSLDAKDQANTPTKVEACAAAYPTEACADFFDGNPVTACVPSAGTLQTGEACGASGQCASTFCAVTQYTICGTCQPLPVAGATCQVQADCGRDLACATPNGATSGTCAAFVASGGACLTGVNPCENGLACVGEAQATSTMGTCQAAATTVGAACDTTHKTMPNCNADMGLVCLAPGIGNIGTCASIELLDHGATCGLIGTPATAFAECTAGGLCKKAAPNDKTGVCVAPAADDAACDNDPSIGPPCLSPAKCVVAAGSSGTAGTCTVPNAATCM